MMFFLYCLRGRERSVDPSHLGSALCGEQSTVAGIPEGSTNLSKNYVSARHEGQHPKELLLLFC